MIDDTSETRCFSGRRGRSRQLGWEKSYDAEYVALTKLHAGPPLLVDVAKARFRYPRREESSDAAGAPEEREGSGWSRLLRPPARHPGAPGLKPNDSKSGRARPSIKPPGRERQMPGGRKRLPRSPFSPLAQVPIHRLAHCDRPAGESSTPAPGAMPSRRAALATPGNRKARCLRKAAVLALQTRSPLSEMQ